MTAGDCFDVQRFADGYAAVFETVLSE